MTLRRGFAALAERKAAELRLALGIEASEALDLTLAAEHLGAQVVPADRLIDPQRLVELERIQSFAFSACTFEIDGRQVIVFNPIREVARQKSDIAHELGHIILNHELNEVRQMGEVSFRTCHADQEEEATALAGALLLPRVLLLGAVRKGMDIPQVAANFGVTEAMARYRINTTGVRRQVAASSAIKRS